MYILTRYVVWEVIKLFLAALGGLTLVFTLGMGVQEGMKMGLTPSVILRILPYMLPEMLGITIPVAILYSVTSVFGRMTGTNEIIAIKSLGISPMTLVWPVLLFAAFLSLGTVWMYEIAATWCRPGRATVITQSIEEVAYSMLQTNHTCGRDCDPFSITVKRVETRDGHRVLIQPTIIVKGPPKITIEAAEAELRTDMEHQVLWLIYRDSRVDVEGQGRIGAIVPGEQRHAISIAPPPPSPYHRDWVSTRRIPDLIRDLKASLVGFEQFRDAKKAGLGEAESKENAEKIEEYRWLIQRLRTEPYRRWANGFTCLCFALLGMPVAMLWRHADGLTNFFVCFLPILVAYYPLLMCADDLTTSGTLPPVFFWMGNVLLGTVAIILLRKVNRH